jgi:DNA-binding transcriptional regulator YhcF (GntR family)
MPFTVDPASATTLYEQLHRQVIEQIESGELIIGTKLPTVRALATELDVAPYTVARVYRALEADGFVETLGRNGTVVKAREGTSVELLQRDATAYAERARDLGLPPADALAYVRAALGL